MENIIGMSLLSLKKISRQCSISKTPEDIRKPKDLWRF